ncbi:MAG TPA: FHA domain-containing protein [Burkholderiales bacterium]|nr:FHA domain-containing protein [Burkholderiales bacterium]
MAKLILSLDGQLIKEFTLSKERTTIGRKPHNDIQIDNLAISGEHAVIMTILNDSFLEDLGSTNGTLVNGQPVKKHFLQGNDIIEIGKYKLKYVNETPAIMSKADFEKTMVLRSPAASAPKPDAKALTDTQTNLEVPTKSSEMTASTPSTATPPADATLPGIAAGAKPDPVTVAVAQSASTSSVTTPGGGTIQILSGPNAGRELSLAKPLTTLGKPGVQVAVIAKRPQGYFITHVEGAQFPVLNGKTLDSQAHQLGDHDIIELASVKMEFFLKP